MKLERREGETAVAAMRRFLHERSPDTLAPAALVRTPWGNAIAIYVGENLSRTWQSGDILFLWDSGEHTSVDDDEEIEIIIPDLWNSDPQFPTS